VSMLYKISACIQASYSGMVMRRRGITVICGHDAIFVL